MVRTRIPDHPPHARHPMKTIRTILDELAAAGLTLSRRQFYRDAARIQLSPLGIRQRPQRWPADSAHRLLSARGLDALQPVRLATMKQLRSIKQKGAR